MRTFRKIYRVLRSILFTAILLVVAFYIGLYVVLSIPSVQNSIKEKLESEATSFLGGKVKAGSLEIHPFNEVILSDVSLLTPEGEKCLEIDRLGAGIHLWRLIMSQKIEITYAEVIGMKVSLWKKNPDSPINIDFLIRAFAPKEKNKPPKKFDLTIHNVLIRKSSLSYDLRWIPVPDDERRFNPAHVYLSDLRADVTLPRIKNDDFLIDLRRLSFKEKSGLVIERLGLKTAITARSIGISGFSLRLPGSDLTISDTKIEFPDFAHLKESLLQGNHYVEVKASKLTPSDLSCFVPELSKINSEFRLDAGFSGNISDFNIEHLSVRDKADEMTLFLSASVNNADDKKRLAVSLDRLNLECSGKFIRMLPELIPGMNQKLVSSAALSSGIEVEAAGDFSIAGRTASIGAMVSAGAASADVKADMEWRDRRTFGGSAIVEIENMALGEILNRPELGDVSLHAEGNISFAGGNIDGDMSAVINSIEYNGASFAGISVNVLKNGADVSGSIVSDDPNLRIDAEAEAFLAAADSRWNLNADIRNFRPSLFGISGGRLSDMAVSGKVIADLAGNNADNLIGKVALENLLAGDGKEKELEINSLILVSETEGNHKNYTLNSDFMNGNLSGLFSFRDLSGFARDIAVKAFPGFVKNGSSEYSDVDAVFDLTIRPDDAIADFFRLPVRPYADIKIDGHVGGEVQDLIIHISAPYILQGTSKMIRNTDLLLAGDFNQGIKADVHTVFPAKNDNAVLDISIGADEDVVNTDISWSFERNKTAVGKARLEAFFSKNPATGGPDVTVNVKPSSFSLNGADWNIGKSRLSYSSKTVSVDNLRIWHDDQFVDINGIASASEDDEIRVALADIDLSYIFEALNINYVTFGGIATGEIAASGLLSGLPVMRTKRLEVKDLSYNGAVLGNGDLESHWDNDRKMVAINADIRDSSNHGAKINGGIFLTRDSLSFDMNADKVNIAFLKPFMSAFTSDVGGRASGKVKLYGTFKDIDLAGKVFADSISMKVDYTNVYYHGSDSVNIMPGHIEIPDFTLYDKYGNTARLSGYVKHHYFHNPEFGFRLNNARNLLCYDTNRRINPDWYGTIFASGSGTLQGRPGIVSIMMDMTTSPNSDFTFVLSETQTAADYTFLTFSDRKKELTEEETGTIDVMEKFNSGLKKDEQSKPSLFSMDIRCTVTPAAKLNLVMDPVAGDKIQARGAGPLQISYDTDTDEMKMYGKYTLAEGNYNFSLQDLILRDFKISPGSSISFNGDPMQGVLDIDATYRVNTNLSDLDKSFSTDRDLNRTNVPVDAVLKVDGDMRSPEISFDISLPTLKQDVERKVKSIISTDDMMNRQIIYLLALNRFYTPEYMGSTSNGGEFASVASSTLSSQLSNMMGQLTDKVTFAPSFRSDKGDFSDMEVDVALSSRLLDNRLLINGNFGYRDRSTSQTTFVGDFDIEYLLNKNGNLRLKAYNHFNDQYYYLKSALTTQGIGIVYRRDFDNPFTFLKRKKRVDKKTKEKRKEKEEDEEKDYVTLQ